ncbi:MAG TPA: Fe2+-dependent dioxygenase [Opitutaceae bacterium]|nr:Fe2+-dependent dioxygenase [Opitutaceae bacterium]
MVTIIPNVLASAALAEARRVLEAADWVDGKATAGHQAASAKDNRQIPPEHPAARQVGGMIAGALRENPLFMAAALPARILPPMFNRYSGGQQFGTHVDGAIRQVPGTPHQIRADLSATLFFAGPEEYDGGELVIQDTYGTKGVKLPAGQLVLYPASSLHHVTPVTRGARLCSFFWIQSLVRDAGDRALLFDLDLAIQRLGADHPGHPAAVRFTGVYHNLLRKWAEI